MKIEDLSKYASVTQISKQTGISRTDILDMCNDPRQKFAHKPNGGKFRINIEKFDAFLKRRERRDRG